MIAGPPGDLDNEAGKRLDLLRSKGKEREIEVIGGFAVCYECPVKWCAVNVEITHNDSNKVVEVMITRPETCQDVPPSTTNA